MTEDFNPYVLMERIKKDRNRLFAGLAVDAMKQWSEGGVKLPGVDRVLYEVEHENGHRYTWYGPDNRLVQMSVGALSLIDKEWNAHLSYSRTTGGLSFMIVGDPDAAMEWLSDLTDNDEVLDALVREFEVLKGNKYRVRPVPGKKRTEKKGPASNTGRDDISSGPVFGRPETGKRGRKR